MVYKYMFFWLFIMVEGCAYQKSSVQEVYAQRYEATVKEQVNQVLDEIQRSDLPLYSWNAPIVQELNVPAHTQNGAYIPEHKELVMIKPGEWTKENVYQTSKQKEKYEPYSENHKSFDVADISSVPNNLGSGSTVESRAEVKDH